MGLTIRDIKYLNREIERKQQAAQRGFNLERARHAVLQHFLQGHTPESGAINKREVEKLDNYETYKDYHELDLMAYAQYVNRLAISAPCKQHFITRYKGILEHIEWCVDYAVAIAEQKPSVNQLQNIEEKVKKLLETGNSGARINPQAWDLIKERIAGLIQADSFRKNVAKIDIQLLVDDYAIRYYQNEFDNDAALKAVLGPEVKAKVGDDVYDATYDGEVDIIVAKIVEAKAAGEAAVAREVAGLHDWVGEQLALEAFWNTLEIDADKYTIDFTQAPFNNVNVIGKKLLQADENPAEYARAELLKRQQVPFVKKAASVIAGLHPQCSGTTLPEYTFVCESDVYAETTKDALDLQINGILGQFFTEVNAFKDLSDSLADVSVYAHNLIYNYWNKLKIRSLENTNSIEKYNSSDDGDDVKIAKYEQYKKDLGKDKSLSDDIRARALNTYIATYKPPVQELFNQAHGRELFYAFGHAVKESIWAYCDGVYTGDGAKGKLVNVSKIFAPFTAIKGAIDTLKGAITKAKEGSAFFEEDHNIDWGGTLLNAADAGDALLDALTGCGVVVAVAGIVQLGRDAGTTYTFWKDAKSARKLAAQELEVAESADILPGGKLLTLQQKYTSLTLAVNNSLRRFITDCVEILKRLIGIVAAALKFMGLTYIAGVSLSLLKGVMHLFQNAYYMGRAIYKRMKGIKGVARRESAEFFVQEAITGKPYALTILLDSKILAKAKFDTYKRNDGADQVTDYTDISLEIKIYKLLKDKIPNQNYGKQFRKDLVDELFGTLSVKPAAQLSITMFPGLGVFKTGAQLAGAEAV